MRMIFFKGGLLLAILLLTGCQKPTSRIKPVAMVPESSPPVSETADVREEARLRQCQQELDVLQSLPGDGHRRYQAAFNQMMGGAAQYAGVRAKVGTETQDTLDALYRYRLSLLCVDIHRAVVTGLSARGDGKP